jgi:GH25 family lysozyme M1 (1,4-beta-N-acetylmuramidase)
MSTDDDKAADELMASGSWLERASLPVASAQGVDVSNFQGFFDWQSTRGLSFGIFRLTEGLGGPGTNSPDPTARHNHDGIAARGLHRGAYHFLRPDLGGAAQARYFVDQADRLGLAELDMLWLDNESDRGVGAPRTAACARDFMAEFRHLRPHQPGGVYTYISFATSGHTAGLGGYPLWLADPSDVNTGPKPPPPWARWAFWQWGIRNGLDRDAFNGTAADLTEWLNAFLPHNQPPPDDHPGRQVERIVTAKGTTLAGILARREMAFSTLLRLSAAAAADGQYPATTARWINEALHASPALHEELPAGLVLHGYRIRRGAEEEGS